MNLINRGKTLRVLTKIFILIIYQLIFGCGDNGNNGNGDQFNVNDIERVSLASDGSEANSDSFFPSISSKSLFIAFGSDATNLVPGDTNSAWDIFVHDRQTGQTTLVSVSSSGVQGNDRSNRPSISSDGRYVAFHSWADNLVAEDSNGQRDIFVHDRQTDQTTLASVSSTGVKGNSDSGYPSISSDGRYVAFASWAENLVDDDSNECWDIFVHDRQTGQTTLVSVSSTGVKGNSNSEYPSISSDGRYVAFHSDADNLVAEDSNGQRDIFVHDRQTDQTTLASVSSTGVKGNSNSEYPSISFDGRYVAFVSWAENLVDDDSNECWDIFVHDRQTDQTTLVSVSSSGVQRNSDSIYPSISSDGRYVAFNSWAENLVDDDSNEGWDIFVHDRQTDQTTLVSVSSTGVKGNSESHFPTISSEGWYVAFHSWAENLVQDDTNAAVDIFVVPNPLNP